MRNDMDLYEFLLVIDLGFRVRSKFFNTFYYYNIITYVI